MKKYLFPMFLVSIFGFCLTSCGGDDEIASTESILVGEWQECMSNGEFKDDKTDYDVMHLRLRSNGTGDWWFVTKGEENAHKNSFNYSYSINGTSGTITMTITSSTIKSEEGKTQSIPFSYIDGILHIGDIYYKKI